METEPKDKIRTVIFECIYIYFCTTYIEQRTLNIHSTVQCSTPLNQLHKLRTFSGQPTYVNKIKNIENYKIYI